MIPLSLSWDFVYQQQLNKSYFLTWTLNSSNYPKTTPLTFSYLRLSCVNNTNNKNYSYISALESATVPFYNKSERKSNNIRWFLSAFDRFLSEKLGYLVTLFLFNNLMMFITKLFFGFLIVQIFEYLKHWSFPAKSWFKKPKKSKSTIGSFSVYKVINQVILLYLCQVIFVIFKLVLQMVSLRLPKLSALS